MSERLVRAGVARQPCPSARTPESRSSRMLKDLGTPCVGSSESFQLQRLGVPSSMIPGRKGSICQR
eukprot:12609789-Alexandrium_andersonii.AAC.1